MKGSALRQRSTDSYNSRHQERAAHIPSVAHCRLAQLAPISSAADPNLLSEDAQEHTHECIAAARRSGSIRHSNGTQTERPSQKAPACAPTCSAASDVKEMEPEPDQTVQGKLESVIDGSDLAVDEILLTSSPSEWSAAESTAVAERLLRLHFFADASATPAMLKSCLSKMKHFEVEAGGCIFQQGGKPSSFFVLLRGRVQSIRANSLGHKRLLHEELPGDGFGELGFITSGPNVYSAIAAEKSQLLSMPFSVYISHFSGAAEARLAKAVETLRSVPRFEGMSSSDYATLAYLARQSVLPAGSVLHTQHELAATDTKQQPFISL